MNEETYDETKFSFDKDCRGAIQDEMRRTGYIPCQRARTIGPEEMRQTHREQADKLKKHYFKKMLK